MSEIEPDLPFMVPDLVTEWKPNAGWTERSMDIGKT